jgi:hypothetical protein
MIEQAQAQAQAATVISPDGDGHKPGQVSGSGIGVRGVFQTGSGGLGDRGSESLGGFKDGVAYCLGGLGDRVSNGLGG